MSHLSAVSCLMSHHLQVPATHHTGLDPGEHGCTRLFGATGGWQVEGYRGILGARTSVHRYL